MLENKMARDGFLLRLGVETVIFHLLLQILPIK